MTASSTSPGLYSRLYPAAVKAVLAALDERRYLHGSEIRDIVFRHIPPSGVRESYTVEKLIDEMGLVALECRPTPSQKAFTGLQYRKHPGFVPGCKLHFVFARHGLKGLSKA